MHAPKITLDILQEVGAIITGGHFRYTSGMHGSVYVNKDALYPHTAQVSNLCQMIAAEAAGICLGEDGRTTISAIVGPEKGGIILSQWVAHHLSEICERQIFSVYAEKSGDGNFVFRRGYDTFVRDSRVLIVEDVTTSGATIRKVVAAVKAAGGHVVGVIAICNRGGVTSVDIGTVPYFTSLCSLELEAWTAEECSLCEEKIPINTELGKGKEFLAAQSA